MLGAGLLYWAATPPDGDRLVRLEGFLRYSGLVPTLRRVALAVAVAAFMVGVAVFNLVELPTLHSRMTSVATRDLAPLPTCGN